MPDIKSTFKSRDTEEWIDIVFTRPIGYCWMLFFKRLGVHPNVVTVLSMILGAAAGVCFFFSPATSPRHWLLINITGVLLLMWANFYDSCDGQLARATGKTTRLGRILDGAAGDIWYFFIYWAVVLRMWNECIPLTHLRWSWIGLALGLFDGFVAHTRQCRLADYYRSLYLFFQRGAKGTLDNFPQQKALYEQAKWKDNFIWKFFLGTYVNYVREQEKTTPQFQRLLRKLREKYGEDIPESFSEEFCRRSYPILWCTNALTFNQRALGLYLACLLNLPWLLFVVEILYLGCIYFYMKRRHERMCRKLLEEL
ncbi:MAG: CDP-alcohol phosphatidyltransferase family protein [Prevotellaceae bacterium]|nr:CDP-alcohol phosphatidyltransferase family protein [Prevotellaceae bacterium]